MNIVSACYPIFWRWRFNYDPRDLSPRTRRLIAERGVALNNKVVPLVIALNKAGIERYNVLVLPRNPSAEAIAPYDFAWQWTGCARR